jgi:hypothetical protein
VKPSSVTSGSATTKMPWKKITMASIPASRVVAASPAWPPPEMPWVIRGEM